MRMHTTEAGNQYEVNEAPVAPSAAIAAAGYITDFDYEGDWPTLDVNDPSLSDANVDGQGGTAANGKPIYDLDQVIANLNRTSYPGTDIPGPGWSGEGYDAIPESGDPMVLSFGFHTAATMFAPPYVYTGANGGLFGRSEYFGFAPFTAAQEAAARDAIRSWDDLIAPTIVETSAADADITFGNLMNRPGTQAYAYLPYNYGGASSAGLQGDVWITGTTASNFQLDEGLYGMNTLVHELGHSLGLQHPGSYNFAPGFSVTYANGAEYFQDARNYSIMSYWNPRDIGARDFDWTLSTIAYGSTPMIHDIATMHAMYGADMTTRTDDTIYGFNSNAGRDYYDFDLTPAPMMAIWDAGGNDTLDTSGFGTNQIIDLRAGSLSSIGGITLEDAPTFEEVNANRAAAGYGPVALSTYEANMAALNANPQLGRLTDNVGIAYGATIENAIGGSGNDVMTGNEVSNVLTGNGGDDTLTGGDGVDLMTGGSGNDIFVAEVNDTATAAKQGDVSVDVILDFAAGSDRIDLSGIDANALLDGHQAFEWAGKSSGNDAGDLTWKSYGNINAAEKVLGIDIASDASGPVSVIFGNTDGDQDPEFALIMIGTDSISATDFIYG